MTEKTQLTKGALLYTGKAKNLYATQDPDVLWVEYTNQATAGNGAKKAQIAGKGHLNNLITTLIFQKLESLGVKTHFIEQISETEQLNTRVKIIPLEVVLRNVVAGSFATRFGLAEGAKLPEPIVEFYYKDDALQDPFVNDEHVRYLGIADDADIAFLKRTTREVNEHLTKIFADIDLTLVDFKLEYGRDAKGQILLADEITPDGSRLWDAEGKHHDKDVFRRDLGDLIPVYEDLLAKLEKSLNK